MSESDIRQRIRQIFETVLDRPIGPDENVAQAEEPEWSSVKHIEIVFMIEEELGLTFEPAEIAGMVSLDACVAHAAGRLETSR